MLIFYLAFLPAVFGLFFDLGGGGCSCSSNCAAPPPVNFGCRLMCAGQTMACQQQAFTQTFNQQQYAQPNYGAQATGYENNYNYQQQANYARQLPQFGYAPQAQQQPAPAYVPPAPARYVDNYATAGNNVQSGYQPQASGAAPVLALGNENPLPATFVSAEQPAAASYSSETTRTDEVRLIPPDQSSSVVVQTAVQPVTSQQNANYATAQEVRTNYAQNKEAKNDFPFSIAEKNNPEDIVKSIEDSYDEQEEEQDQQQVTPSVPRLDFKAISVNYVTLPTVSYVTTDRILPALQETGTENEIEKVKPEPKTVEYALGSLSPAKAMVPVETVKAAAQQYKTLTRGEGTSNEDKISQSGYDYKDVEPRKAEDITAAPEQIVSTEDYASEEKGSEDTAAEDTSESEDPSDYQKSRSVERTYDPTEITETTTDARPAKRSQIPDSNTFKCNSEKLKEIMKAKMTVSAPVSKQLIYAEATAEFPGLSLDVICSRHSFSYIVVTSPIYCEHRKSPLTCFAFFQP